MTSLAKVALLGFSVFRDASVLFGLFSLNRVTSEKPVKSTPLMSTDVFVRDFHARYTRWKYCN